MHDPTTGRHLEDIRKLAKVFDRLLEQGHTLVLIEHNLDVIKLADWIIDLGPEGGVGGGQLGAVGRPADIGGREEARGRARGYRGDRGVAHGAVARATSEPESGARHNYSARARRLRRVRV